MLDRMDCSSYGNLLSGKFDMIKTCVSSLWMDEVGNRPPWRLYLLTVASISGHFGELAGISWPAGQVQLHLDTSKDASSLFNYYC